MVFFYLVLILFKVVLTTHTVKKFEFIFCIQKRRNFLEEVIFLDEMKAL